MTKSTRCTATCRNGAACRAWAVRGSDPPRCVHHGGSTSRTGAPRGNTNAVKHGFYAGPQPPDGVSIDAIIENLYERQLRLDAVIDEILVANQASLVELTHLLQLHGQNASRLGRLLRDRRALSGDAADGISDAIAKALDELGSEWGGDL